MPLNSGAKCVTQLGHFAKKREELGRHILDRRWQGLLCLHGTTCLYIYGCLRSSILSINVKNCHGSLTTVVMAQNDTSKTANITVSIHHVESYTRPYQRSHAANWGDETVLRLWACAVRVSFVIIYLNTVSVNCCSLQKHCTVSNCKRHPTAFAKMLVYSHYTM